MSRQTYYWYCNHIEHDPPNDIINPIPSHQWSPLYYSHQSHQPIGWPIIARFTAVGMILTLIWMCTLVMGKVFSWLSLEDVFRSTFTKFDVVQLEEKLLVRLLHSGLQSAEIYFNPRPLQFTVSVVGVFEAVLPRCCGSPWEAGGRQHWRGAWTPSQHSARKAAQSHPTVCRYEAKIAVLLLCRSKPCLLCTNIPTAG